MNKHWYKQAVVGLTPFDSGGTTDKTNVSPVGHMGGDSHGGAFAPSDNNHHANDYIGEDEKNHLIEKALREKQKKKKKKKKKIAQIQEDPIIQKVLNATVTLTSTHNQGQEVGSGFFIAPNVILTCSHVVVPTEPNVNRIIRYKGQEYQASIWAYDVGLDTAIVVVNDASFHNPDFLIISNSDNVALGEEVVLSGTPLGFENIIGKGIVTGKPVHYQDDEKNTNYMFVSIDVQPGNSGGPLAKQNDGTVIGIVDAVISAEEAGNGLSAITPINDIKNFLTENQINIKTQE
jgi:S1-C subfamily serine protease